MNKEFESRATFRSAAFLVLKKDGKVLLSKRINTSHEDGNYGLVAGHLEKGETPQEAIVREAKEEIGLDIKEEDLEVVHVSFNQSELDYFQIYLTPKKWQGEVENREPERCADLAWFAEDSLPPNTIKYIAFVLGKIKEGVMYSNFGK